MIQYTLFWEISRVSAEVKDATFVLKWQLRLDSEFAFRDVQKGGKRD